MQPPPRKGSGSGSGLKVVLALAVVAVVVVGGFVLLGGGDDRDDGSGGEGDGDPAQVLVDFLAASNAGDCTTAMGLLTEASVAVTGGAGLPEAIAACEAELAGGGEMVGAGVTVSDTEVVSNDGTTAVVAITATVDGSTETTEMTLRDENGAWRIDLTDIGGSASSGGGAGGDSAEAPPAQSSP
ncbi:MAG: hypothetical protein ACRD2C_27505 [Acidimicrobiales bacterium]